MSGFHHFLCNGVFRRTFEFHLPAATRMGTARKCIWGASVIVERL